MTPRPLPSSVVQGKNRESTPDALLVLVEFAVPTDPGTRFRFVANPKQVTWQEHIYYPASMKFGLVREDVRGSLPELSVTFDNVRRMAMRYLEEFDLSGTEAVISVIQSSDLETPNAAWSDRFRLLSAQATEVAVDIRLGQFNAYGITLPTAKVMRDGCRDQYRDDRCGYLGALDTCDKTRTGANGCNAHAVDSPDHPRRFGGAALLPVLESLAV